MICEIKKRICDYDYYFSALRSIILNKFIMVKHFMEPKVDILQALEFEHSKLTIELVLSSTIIDFLGLLLPFKPSFLQIV